MFYTNRLMLRNLDLKADHTTLIQWLNDQDIMEAMVADAVRPTSREGVIEFVQARAKHPNGLPFFAICERPTEGSQPGRPCADGGDFFVMGHGASRYPIIGLLNINNSRFSFTNRTAMLGIAFDVEHRGQKAPGGYGTEVLSWACEYMFGHLGLHRCELEAHPENHRALQCYRKVGFRDEGTKREALWRNGKWHDTVMMAILEKDWWVKQDARRTTN
ncbi:acyl-CoA N-acyltransferase [Teratosphaeria destructans]|uniref:Acyl-CoA N-acyltransferase n=1 Tax=Teratosphaeria destructans TaxID=418781 RepID=A0A9W7SSD4_9PEZI|nr:acyl-CoA N-acyltransferase [Teratosphaeria destructans]